jgi:hypothetical protein
MDAPHERLKAARAQAGYRSAADACQAYGWKEAAYRHHENGTRGFYDIGNAVRYARAFRVSPAWLLGIDDDARAADAIPSVEVLSRVVSALFRAAPRRREVPPEALGAYAGALQDILGMHAADAAGLAKSDILQLLAQKIADRRRGSSSP